jgi:tetratricopeptide (TPR) repeat protein
MADEGYFEEAITEYHKALNSSASKNPSLESEICNNLGWSYAQSKQEEKAQEEFKKAKRLDPMNIKAIRNLRAIDKAIKFQPKFSRSQICISAVLAILLLSSYVLFLIGKLSETLFITQTTLLMALIIFVLYSNQLARFKMGTLELEMNERSPESKRIAVTSKLERT